MFANLKNKLIEEVKASPSKFQQFANAAQVFNQRPYYILRQVQKKQDKIMMVQRISSRLR